MENSQIKPRVKGRINRPAAWRRRRRSRLVSLTKGLWKQLTFKRLLLFALFLPLLLYLYQEVDRDVLIIDPFSVPKRFEEAGLTPEVVAHRIGNALRRIEVDAHTRAKKDKLTALRHEGSQLDIELPGTKLGLKTAVEIIRVVFGIHPKHVSGDIIELSGSGSSGAGPRFRVTIYADDEAAASLDLESTDPEVLSQETAKIILGQVNPLILAVHYYQEGNCGEFSSVYSSQLLEDSCDKSLKIVHLLINNSSENHQPSAAIFNLLGLLLIQKKDYDGAVDGFRKAAMLDPKDSWILNNWGNVLYLQGKYGDAIAKYKGAIELDPKYARAHYNWGRTLHNQNKYKEAITEYQKAIALDPKNSFAYAAWGVALADQGEYVEATTKFHKAIELDLKRADVYTAFGTTLAVQTKYEEAITEYQRAIELNPRYAVAYLYWGKALVSLKNVEQAIVRYQKAVELDPGNPQAHEALGTALQSQRKAAEAEREFAKARELSSRTASPP